MGRIGADRQVFVGLVTLIVVVGVVIVGIGRVVPMLFAPGGETVVAHFETTGQLETGDLVRIDGVEVGAVDRIEVGAGGRRATVTMTIQEKGWPLYRDARAAIRWRLLLGGTRVVDLDPGTAGSGELGDDAIPASRTSDQVEFDHLTTALGGEAERGWRQFLHELPPALGDGSAWEAGLSTLADTSPAIGRAAEAFRGERDGDLTALVRSTARTLRALEPAGALVEGAARTFSTTARRQADLRRWLRAAPPAMKEVTTTLGRLERTLALADPLFASLERPAADLAPTADALRPFLTGTDRLLDAADPLFGSLRPALGDLGRAGREGTPLFEELRPTLQRFDQRLLPGLAKVDPASGRPSFQMIGPTFAAATGAAGGFDADSTYFNFSLGTHPDVVGTDPCRVVLSDPDDIASCRSILGVLRGGPAKRRRSRR